MAGRAGSPSSAISSRRSTVSPVGDRIEGEITLYDPEVFVSPINARLSFQRDKETAYEDRMQFNTCTDTNGPSPNVYMDDKGLLNARTPGDPLYWEPADPRPWATYLNESDKRYKASGLTRTPGTGLRSRNSYQPPTSNSQGDFTLLGS